MGLSADGESHHIARPSSAQSSNGKRFDFMATYAPVSLTSFRRSGIHGKDAGIVGQASWASSVINLVNTSVHDQPRRLSISDLLLVVGSGVLAMPLAMSHMGLLLGCLIISWSGITAGFGLYLQTRCARYLERGTASFYAVSQVTYPSAAVVFDGAIALKCFGVAVSYLIIIGNLMPGVVEGMGANVEAHGFLADRKFWITGFM